MTPEQLDNWFSYHEPTTDEQLAESLYSTWRDQPGWVPWVPAGNSHKQDEARKQTRGHGTAPKYAAIRETELHVVRSITQAHFENVGTVALYGCINAACKHFASVIDEQAPDAVDPRHDDKSAAIRCVRLARNLFNEWGTQIGKEASKREWANPQALFVAAELELCKARMQANSAIACGGK